MTEGRLQQGQPATVSTITSIVTLNPENKCVIMETRTLIQHEQLATTTRPKVTIGPKAKTPTNIKLNKTGDVIESIEIVCACGETIVIQCEYE